MNAAKWQKRLAALPGVRLVLCGVGAILFLLVAYLVLYGRTDLWHLWLPASSNNDEVIYNRQLAGVLTGGQPEGVFGYNENRAPVGHFGGWGPVLLWLYALPGLFTGGGVNAMFWCNLFFAVAGWMVFAAGTGLSARRQLLGGIVLFCCWYPVQQVFTGAAEPLQFFLIFAILGATVALRRKFRVGWFVVLILACALTTLTRAYTVLFWLYPVALFWRSRRRLAVASVVGALLSLAGYLVVAELLSAAFFNVSIDMTAFTLLAGGQPVQAVVYGFTKLGSQLVYLWQEGIAPLFRGDFQDLGMTAVLVFFLLVLQAVLLVRDHLARRPVLFPVCTLAIAGISLLGLLELYAMYAISRHFIMLAMFLVAAMACCYGRALCWCLVAAVWLPFQLQAASLPIYNETMDTQLQTLQTVLEARDEAQTSGDPWAHTLAYAFRDDVFHGYLYGVPAGMGIQFDYNTYLADAANPIHSQYVMVGHGSDAEARLLAEGWQELVSTQDLIVYERPAES